MFDVAKYPTATYIGKFSKFNGEKPTEVKGELTLDGGTSIPNGGGAQASPVAYVVRGKEFVVNAFGGNVPYRQFAPNPVGDAIVAFSLP